MFLRYAQAASLDLSTDMYLFRPLYRSKKKCALVKQNKPISYTTARVFFEKIKGCCTRASFGFTFLEQGGIQQQQIQGYLTVVGKGMVGGRVILVKMDT